MRNIKRLTALYWLVCLVLVSGLLTFTAFAGEETNIIQINGELEPKTREETMDMVESVTDAYFQDPEIAAQLEAELDQESWKDIEGNEMEVFTLTHDGHSMSFRMEIRGEADENGKYPLYIALHGGGESEPEFNDFEWDTMYHYYRESVENGIYVAVRGISDTWDLHFQEASYPLYDRLIRTMIYLYQADPNRVYLLGFSAGGDGVYQIAPRMADRFAAANMSSGHPNGVSLMNLANCPFSIQVGVRDYYSESAMRCIRGAEFDQVLNDYHDEIGYGYEHQVLVRVPAGHNYNDWEYEAYADVLTDLSTYSDPDVVEPMMKRFQEASLKYFGTDNISELSYRQVGENADFDQAIQEIVTEEFHLNTEKVNGSAVHYVSQFSRNPVPELIQWDLVTRAPSREVSSFYWLKADHSVNSGFIRAKFEGNNNISIKANDVNGDFSILINPFLFDVSEPIHIVTDFGEYDVRVNPSEDILMDSLKETGDPTQVWAAEIPFSLLSGEN